jgi:hypothetical protein
MEKTGVAPWIESNLWAILCAVSTGAGGVLIGMTTTNSRLNEVEKDLGLLQALVSKNSDSIDRKLMGRSDFMVCAARQVDRLNNAVGIDPPCQLEVPE